MRSRVAAHMPHAAPQNLSPSTEYGRIPCRSQHTRRSRRLPFPRNQRVEHQARPSPQRVPLVGRALRSSAVSQNHRRRTSSLSCHHLSPSTCAAVGCTRFMPPISVAGAAWPAAPTTHSAKVRAIPTSTLVLVNFNFDAATTSLGDPRPSRTPMSTSTMLGPPPSNRGHRQGRLVHGLSVNSG